MTKKPTTVAAYISAAASPARSMLTVLRATIRSAAPQAEEKISYGMPYYGYFGRLIYFAAFKRHVGIYIMGASRDALPPALAKYRTTNATLQLPLGTRIPVAAIKKIVVAQMRENRAKANRASR